MSGKLTLTGPTSTTVDKDLRLSVKVEGQSNSKVSVSLEHTSGAEPLLSSQTKEVRLSESGTGSVPFEVKFQGVGHATLVAKGQDTENTFFPASAMGVDVR